MKRIKIFFIFGALIFTSIQGLEYLYPVAQLKSDDVSYIYLLHQISLNKLQLLQWDAETKLISPALPSSINPAGIKILPNNSGFSFIDQGSLYLKLFSKRSPIKVDISLPLYHIETVEWIDTMHCYCTACYQEKFNIYQISTAGDVHIIQSVHDADCLYPQLVQNQLFYIERSWTKKNYYIKRKPYALFTQNTDYRETEGKSDILFDAECTPIAFLHMANSTEGFFLTYPEELESETECLPLEYHRLFYDKCGTGWKVQPLFTFSIPLDFIVPDSPDRLHESLMALLPQHTAQGIYYCDCTPEDQPKKGMRNLGGSWYEAEPVKIYWYDFLSQKSTLQANDCARDLLGLLALEKKVFYGYSMKKSSKTNLLLPGMWRNESGRVRYDAPNIIIS